MHSCSVLKSILCYFTSQVHAGNNKIYRVLQPDQYLDRQPNCPITPYKTPSLLKIRRPQYLPLVYPRRTPNHNFRLNQ